MENLFPFVLLALAVLLLFVLPARQRNRARAQAQAMQESLAVGTPIMTTSGIHGTVAALGEATVDVEIAPGVVVTFVRAAVLEIRSSKVAGTGPAATNGTASPAPDPGAPGGTGGPADGTR